MMTRALPVAAGLFCGPLSGPFAYGCIRCLQARRYVMAGWYAAAVLEVWLGLAWLAAKGWGVA